MYEWNFDVIFAQKHLLASGAVYALYLLASSLSFAIVVGTLAGIIRFIEIPFISRFVGVLIDFFRSSVVLILIYWFYFAFPILVGIHTTTFVAVTLAIGLQASGFMAELVRGGIASIAKGQWESARALGMPYATTMRYIILPQAVKRMIPVFFLLLIEILKNTSLAGIVAYPEIYYQSTQIASATFRPVETFTVLGIIYILTISFFSGIMKLLEVRLARTGG